LILWKAVHAPNLADQSIADAEIIAFRRANHIGPRRYGLHRAAQDRLSMGQRFFQLKQGQIADAILVNASGYLYALPAGEDRPHRTRAGDDMQRRHSHIVGEGENGAANKVLPGKGFYFQRDNRRQGLLVDFFGRGSRVQPDRIGRKNQPCAEKYNPTQINGHQF
jgi:hypothetical protein